MEMSIIDVMRMICGMGALIVLALFVFAMPFITLGVLLSIIVYGVTEISVIVLTMECILFCLFMLLMSFPSIEARLGGM